MATIKSFTSLEQSKKLVKILPLETTDMCYVWDYEHMCYTPELFGFIQNQNNEGVEYIDYPCWSLAALLGVIKSVADYTMQSLDCKKSFIVCELGDKPWNITAQYDNEIDACVEMIVKLHELNLL